MKAMVEWRMTKAISFILSGKEMQIRRYLVVSLLALIATIVAACAAPTPTPIPTPTFTPVPTPTPPPTPTPTPPPTPPSFQAGEVQAIEITFDGERCQYEGPEATVEGQVVMILNNPTDHQQLHLHVGEFFVEGRTWQDLVEYMEGLTIERPPPIWIREIFPTSVDGDPGVRRFQERYFREWEHSLDPGSYGIVCAAHADDPRGIWLAAPLEVRPASSE